MIAQSGLARQEQGLQFWRIMNEGFDQHIDDFRETLRAYLNDQQETVLANLSKELEEQANIPQILNVKEANKLFMTVMTNVYLANMTNAGNQSLILIGLQPNFNIASPAVARFQLHRMALASSSINTVTNKKLRGILTNGINKGLAIRELKNQIGEVYKQARGYRAENIARTETISTANFSAKEAWVQSEVVEAKEWFTNPGACPLCEPLHGKIIGLDENYFNLGETAVGTDGREYDISYDDIGEPDLHPNGRCTILPVMLNV